MRRWASTRRRSVAVALLVAAAVGAAVWAVLLRGGAPQTASTEPASSYRVAYRVETLGDPSPVRSNEVVEVERPYRRRVEVREDPDGPPRSVTVTNRRFFWSFGEEGEEQVGTLRPPGRLDEGVSGQALRAAADEGLVERGDPREVAGEPCATFAYREPPPAPLAEPTAEDRVAVCVSPDGILLREEWRLGGDVVRLREAVAVDRPTDLDDDRFLVGRQPSGTEASQLLASQRVVEEDVVPVDDPLTPELPEGFEEDRRAAVTTTGGSLSVRAFVQSFRRGEELVVVEQGTEELGGPDWDPAQGREIDEGRIIHRPSGVEVRMVLDGRWARVEAAGRELAREVARSLG